MTRVSIAPMQAFRGNDLLGEPLSFAYSYMVQCNGVLACTVLS